MQDKELTYVYVSSRCRIVGSVAPEVLNAGQAMLAEEDDGETSTLQKQDGRGHDGKFRREEVWDI